MNPQTLSAPAELTLSTLAVFLERLLSSKGPVQVDLAATTEIDLAGIQLLVAAARDHRITFTQARPAPLVAVCRAVGVDPTSFQSGDSDV